MLKNYFKIAVRNILKNKVYSFINIAGLSIGIAVTILILLFVQNELSFDSFHKNKEKIYRVIAEEKRNNEKIDMSVQPPPLGPALVSEFPEIKSAVRFFGGEAIVSYGANKFNEEVKFTDPAIFSMFSFPLLQGNPNTALTQPNSVVLTETTANKIFGNENPINKLLKINLNDKVESYIVTGVAKDISDNSSIDFSVLLPVSRMPSYQKRISDWTSFYGSTFILVSGKSKIPDIERNLARFTEKYFGGYISESQANGWIDKSKDAFKLKFQPLLNIHLGNIKFGMELTGNPVYSYVLSIIAFIILFIACINFITLSLGRSTARSKEVGVRKVLGAGRNNIVKQFWSESILLTLSAFIISLFLVELLLPLFNQLSGNHFNLGNVFTPGFLLILAALILLVGILAGSYPSVIMSRFQPVDVLKGKMKIGHGSFLSRALVVIQFSLAIILITGSVIVWFQLKYIQAKDLGYNGDQVIVIPVDWGQGNGDKIIDLFKNKLSGYPGVVNISGTNSAFAQGWSQKLFGYNGVTHKTYLYRVDENYISILGLHLLEGRNFIKGSSTDSSQSIIVNEAFVKSLGWKLPAVGNKINDWLWDTSKVELKIIGVVKDFNFESLHDEIKPAMLTMTPDWGESSMMIKISKENIPLTISFLKKVYGEILPDRPFEFTFLNDNVQKQYNVDRKLGKIVGSSSIFAILISSLGLFGLTLLSVSSRTKEVGIRKVLGASVNNIVTIISKDFLKLVLISNVIAWPAAWYAANKWLQDFAYRINISIWIFLLASLLAFLIVLVTISFQAIKAATANPVKSLRYE